MAEQDKRKAQGQQQQEEGAVRKAEPTGTGAVAGNTQPEGSDRPRETRLNRTADEPSYVAPGDGPFDTVDPSEHASSVAPRRDEVAAQGFGVVNAVVPIPDPSGLTQRQQEAEEGGAGEARTQRYQTPGPRGEMVEVEHNLDTGETRVV